MALNKYYCSRCMTGMVMLGKRQMQFLPEVIGFSDFLPVEVHICPQCGKIDTFADYGERPEELQAYIARHMDGDSPDAIPQSKFSCPQCKTEFDPGLLICPNCGLDLSRPAPKAPADKKDSLGPDTKKPPRRKLPWEF